MNDTDTYDGELQMVREAPAAVNLANLQFMRWLIEQGRLEHLPAGPPSGPLAEPPAAAARLGDAA
jgi:hypothetical protein